MLFSFCTFKDEKELLSSFPPIHQNKLQEKGAQDLLQFSENLINNQDPHRQIENEKTP